MALATRLRSVSHWSDPRVKPPFGAVTVDRDSGVVMMGLLNEGAGGPHDIRQDRLATLSSGATWTKTSKGLGVSLPAGMSEFINFGSHAAYQPSSLTVLWQGMWDGGTPAENVTLISEYASGTNGYEIALNTTTGILWWATSVNFAVNNTTYTATPNRIFTAVMVSNQTTGTRVYVDGAQVASDATAGALVWAGTELLRLGARGDAGLGALPGTHITGILWNRPLPPSKAAEVSLSPYQDLRPIIRRRYFIFTPAAGAAENIFTQEHIGRGIGRGILVGR